ncbi:RluA family pseudouridine synthase [Paenibacillus cellulosilyticus]|uniref:Pseudouridine synthase n=1 Tax=Paenibacillus cellulosilyticus TaxID=375489 RepID=A0A2V2YQL4_9BACL|nr:RluA family pseudouridine synthase [Paenibacillus cellulosilyticus]PWV92019.1 RluA family pseudouridine synthase [Paenibacillus cellulosilyticus]QKS46701.1 RluA family pseudouridine synthase [Paenibacillus cellulosilyticus]
MQSGSGISFNWQTGARREGRKLVLLPQGLDDTGERAWPAADSHSHAVKQWLAAAGWFPTKWINLLFSVGGIRMEGERIVLDAFVPADPAKDPLYRLAASTSSGSGSLIAEPLYEDDYVLVMNKPAGMPVHASKPGERGTLDEAAAVHLLKKGDPLPVRHIHRLDNETSGPVLYSKNDLAQQRLDEAMRSKAIDRQYIAFVQGRLARRAGVIDAPIGRDRHHSAKRRAGAGGDPAITHYELLEQYSSAALVSVRLETGRTHQIRVHMSHIGHPLVGDSLYGGSTRLLAHQALHGERLLFTHPLHGGQMEVFSPRPEWYEPLRRALT